MPMAVRIVPNMSPPFELHTSIEKVGRIPALSRRPVAGIAVAHLHLDIGRDGRRPAGVGDDAQLVVRQGVAVHVGGAVGEQPVPLELEDGAALAPVAVADVHGDAQIEILGESEVVGVDLGECELRVRAAPSPS